MRDNELVKVLSPLRDAEPFICAALRGEQPSWPWGQDNVAHTHLLASVQLHGVGPLLHGLPQKPDWPAKVACGLRELSIQQALWDSLHHRYLTEALGALAEAGIEPILIKGSSLAYSLYPDAALRVRGDTDLVIPPEARIDAEHTLSSLGLKRKVGISGEFVSYQASYTRKSQQGVFHNLDLHWKINNSEVLSRLFTYEELRRASIALPRLCARAQGTSYVHAMLIACMHRATHKQNPYYVGEDAHHDANRLIWLYDIHLLAKKMGSDEWEEFLKLATAKGLRAVCLEGLEHARLRFNTRYPLAVQEELVKPGAPEAAARYLNGSKLRQQWMDVCALGSTSRRLQLVSELTFPPAAYMHNRYPSDKPSWLPLLYVRRIVDGLLKRIPARKAGV